MLFSLRLVLVLTIKGFETAQGKPADSPSKQKIGSP
jgi:hypothetical protein